MDDSKTFEEMEQERQGTAAKDSGSVTDLGSSALTSVALTTTTTTGRATVVTQ